MPQVNVFTARRLDEAAKNALQLEIGGSMPILPGKDTDNTAICVCDGCAMYRYGKPSNGAFVDIRLLKPSPEESKKAFAEKLFTILKDTLDIDPDRVYMNFIELEHWASGGGYS